MYMLLLSRIPGINISSVIAVNVLALGLANLIGGLFVIGHDVSIHPFQLLQYSKKITMTSHVHFYS